MKMLNVGVEFLSAISTGTVVFCIFLSIVVVIIRYISSEKYRSDVFGLKQTQTPKINPNVHYDYGVSLMQGKRQYMEDRHAAVDCLNGDSQCSFYAIFDGHGGDSAAQFCSEQMCHYVTLDSNWGENPDKALTHGILRTDKEYLEIAARLNRNDGTTAIVCLTHGDNIHIANVGDSRAILVRKNGSSKPLSCDHKPNRVDEKKRIADLGGSVVFWGVWRVEGILAVSRAIGDRMLKTFVTARPDVQKFVRCEQDQYIVLASDGVWDVLSNEEVARLSLEAENVLTASKVVMEEAYRRGSLDNISALVIDLQNKRS